MVDHRKEEQLVLDHGPSTFGTRHHGAPSAEVTLRDIRKVIRTGGQEITVRRIDIDAGVFHVEGWATVDIEHPVGAPYLWAFMTGLPHLAHEPLGLPVELTIFSSTDSGGPLARVQLHGLGPDEEPTSTDYPNYRTIHEPEDEGSRRTAGSGSQARSARRAFSIGRQRHLGQLHPIDPSRLLSLVGTGDDAAWITKQPTLDRLRTLLNAMTRFLGKIESDEQGIRFLIDWYGKLVSHLDFGSAGNTTTYSGDRFPGGLQVSQRTAPFRADGVGAGPVRPGARNPRRRLHRQ